MKTLSVFLLLACMAIGTRAQEKPAPKENPVKVKLQANYTTIKYQAGELLSAYNPMLSFAIERRKGIWGLQMGIAATIPRTYRYGDSTNYLRRKTFGYGVNAEGRVYGRARLKKKVNQFLGIRAGLNYYNTPFEKFYVDTTYNAPFQGYTHTVSRTKTVFICALVTGVQMRVDEHFMMEFGGGLGYKCKWIVEEGKADVKPPYGPNVGGHEMIHSSDNEGATFALPVIINFCYAL